MIEKFSGDWFKPNGGVEASMINLVNGVNKLNKANPIFIITKLKSKNYINVPDNVNVIRVSSRTNNTILNNLPFFGIHSKIEFEIQKINPDIVHVIGVPSLIRKFNKYPTIFTVHGIPFIDSQSSTNFRFLNIFKYYIYKKVYINSFKRYPNIIHLVSYTKNLFDSYISNSAIQLVIPNSVDFERKRVLESNKKNEKKNILVWCFKTT